MEGAIVLVALLLIVLIVLPIVAIVRTGRIRGLEQRVAGLEAALLRLINERTGAAPPPREAAPPIPAEPVPLTPPAPPAPPAVRAPVPETAAPREHLEQVIGRKWLGWVAILLIFGAAVSFLKYYVSLASRDT